MINVTEEERVHLVSMWSDIVQLIRSNDRKSLEHLRSIIPIYSLTMSCREDGSSGINQRVLSFTYLNGKKHGKKRVYIARDTRGSEYYISYISKNTAVKLCRGDRMLEDWSTLFADRWVITENRYRFKTIAQLLNCVTAVETESRRFNRPPEGQSPNVWFNSEKLIERVSRYRSIKASCHIYSVCLAKYSLEKNNVC